MYQMNKARPLSCLNRDGLIVSMTEGRPCRSVLDFATYWLLFLAAFEVFFTEFENRLVASKLIFLFSESVTFIVKD